MQKAGESRPFLLLKEEALYFQYDFEDAETMGVMPKDSSRRKKAGLIGAPSLVLSGASNEISRENLLNTIYQAALVPEEWSSVLSQMSMAADAKGGLLFTTHLDRIQWTASPELKPLFAAFIRDGWAALNQRPVRTAALNHAGFVRDDDIFTLKEMENDPVYTGFLRKNGMGWGAGTLIHVPSGDSLIFSIERAYAKGPVPREAVVFLDTLRPHLARAALMASRLGLERAQTMAGALQMLGLPAAVLGVGGRITAANDAFEKLMPGMVQDRRDRLHLVDLGADALFGEALSRLSLSGREASVQSIPLAADEIHLPTIIHVLPVRGVAHDIFSRIAYLVVATPIDHGAVPGAQVLQGLFDLTPAEARIAAAIGEGQTVEVIAAAGGVSRETVRSHLKSVLVKVGVSRQVDLVRLLAGAALPR